MSMNDGDMPGEEGAKRGSEEREREKERREGEYGSAPGFFNVTNANPDFSSDGNSTAYISPNSDRRRFSVNVIIN